MPPDDRLGTVHWVVKSFVELAANAGIVGVLVSLENRGGNMHGHAALHVGRIKRQVVDLQHQLGQGEANNSGKGGEERANFDENQNKESNQDIINNEAEDSVVENLNINLYFENRGPKTHFCGLFTSKITPSI